MSSRLLRKIQGDNELNEEASENEHDGEMPSGGARRKQLNVNRYDLLNQLSYSESEVKEDDNETEANKSCEGSDIHESTKRKKKKKKKKSGKSVAAEKSSEDNTEMDEVDRSVKEVNKMLGDVVPRQYCSSIMGVEKPSPKNCKRNILSVQHKHLNPNTELKRIFGSKIIQNEHKKKHRNVRGHSRITRLVSGKESWSQMSKSGLSMSVGETLDKNVQFFNFEHSTNYRALQNRFLDGVESLNPHKIIEILNEHPYHIDAMIQVSELSRIGDNLALSAKFNERALYFLECAFHPTFNIATGKCRIDYRRQENRALYITLFKHFLNVGSRACYRTALEFCKLILSLDPEGDPLAVKLALDFYALRSKEYQWFADLYAEWEQSRNLSQLPNFAFSVSIAYFHLSDRSHADQLLQDALLMFPGVLMPLLEKCAVQVDARVAKHAFFGVAARNKQSPALMQLINLYVHRSYHVWKECDILPWLEKNVHEVLSRVDGNDPLVVEYETKRDLRYQGPLPRPICRHIILSDFKDVTYTPQAEDAASGIMAFDPLPPLDSINIYTRTNRTRSLPSGSTLGTFFRSLLPNYNPDIDEQLFDLGLEDGAYALPDVEAVAAVNAHDLRVSVASLVGAIRDLLGNIRIADVTLEADVDENDDSEDDDLNNYLT